MHTSDPASSTSSPEGSAAGPARMDVRTTQLLVREMTTLTSAMFSLLRPERAPGSGTATPQAEPSPSSPPAAAIGTAGPLADLPVPSIPLPSLPVSAAEAPVAPRPADTAASSIPLPPLPAAYPPAAEARPEAVDKEDESSKDSRQSMALMNEIAFLDD